MSLHLGLAVWAFPAWVGGFYPPGTRGADTLRRFGERMRCVEGNTLFYAVPELEVLHRWARETPEGFHFCPKVPRDLSHAGPLAPRAPALCSLLAHLREGLGERLGPLFLQLPPTFGPDQGPDLAALLNAWRRETDHPLLVELRHPAWFEPGWAERVDTLLGRLGLGRVMLDTRPVYAGPDDPQAQAPRRKPRLPLRPVRVGPRVMVRYISHPELDRNTPWLEEWAARVHGWLDEGVEVWFFVHCPQEEHSPEVARRFQRTLASRGAPVPPLPWDALPPPPQVGLF